jgi:hypothetical protein
MQMLDAGHHIAVVGGGGSSLLVSLIMKPIEMTFADVGGEHVDKEGLSGKGFYAQAGCSVLRMILSLEMRKCFGDQDTCVSASPAFAALGRC